jgi:hypothetical protein
MPYKDKEKQKASQRKSYEKHKTKIAAGNSNKRKELGTYKKDRIKELSEYVQKLKENKPCADCGNIFHYCAMDFDHVYGEKFASISQLVVYGYGKDTIDKEIEKCELVCSNCHRVRTFKKRNSF